MTFNSTVIFRGHQLEIEFEVCNFDIGNSGIGAYEYCGCKGYDKGYDYVEGYDLLYCDVWSERRQKMVRVNSELGRALVEAAYEQHGEDYDNALWEKYQEDRDEREERMADAQRDRMWEDD